MSCYVTLRCHTLLYIALCCVDLHYLALHYFTLRCVGLRCVRLRCVTFCYVIVWTSASDCRIDIPLTCLYVDVSLDNMLNHAGCRLEPCMAAESLQCTLGFNQGGKTSYS